MKGRIYRFIMKIAHRYDWHRMDKSYPDGDTMLRCHWCGLRVVTKKAKSNVATMLQKER